jgi:hypothetical protein
VPPLRWLTRLGRRTLARQLARLGDRLEDFTARLRQAVSAAVGDAVAGVVRETAHAALAAGATASAPPPASTPPHPARPLWARPEEADDDPWLDAPDHDPPDPDDEPPAHRTGRADAPSRLPCAAAAGLHAALDWLGRGVGRWPVRTAVAVGLLTALATYAGGPLAAAQARAWVGAGWRKVRGTCATVTGAAARAVAAVQERWRRTRQFRVPVLWAAAVGLAAGAAAYAGGPYVAAAAWWLAGFSATLATHAGIWLRRTLSALPPAADACPGATL